MARTEYATEPTRTTTRQHIVSDPDNLDSDFKIYWNIIFKVIFKLFIDDIELVDKQSN